MPVQKRVVDCCRETHTKHKKERTKKKRTKKEGAREQVKGKTKKKKEFICLMEKRKEKTTNEFGLPCPSH
jgi:hypothetical protein